jgi:hypothetical protein
MLSAALLVAAVSMVNARTLPLAPGDSVTPIVVAGE